MKIILIYVALVGCLLLGLLEILRIGEKLNAPANISGEWEINNEFAADVSRSCMHVLFRETEPRLSIDQSGVYLKALFNDISHIEMEGRLVNNKIVLKQINQFKNNPADVYENKLSAELYLTVIQDNKKPGVLLGDWKISNCDNCRVIIFSAIKKSGE
jgi:hypothetical protein